LCVDIFVKMTKADQQIDSVLAREADGTIQITFKIPFAVIKSSKEEALAELAHDTEIPGFRKGRAPITKVKERISESTLIEKTLAKLLPKALGDAITKFSIKPLIYPRFELVSAKEDEDWQIRATTCEMPEIKLGDYQNAIASTAKVGSIWTPDKGKSEKPKEKTKEEKEQEVIKVLISTSEVNVPRPLIDEEVDTRLAGLLERTERLGLSLEKYLASIGKTPETLRGEYQVQAREALKLDLVLSRIAEEKDIKVSETEIDAALKENAADEKSFENLNTPERRRLIASILKKRSALDSLTSLL